MPKPERPSRLRVQSEMGQSRTLISDPNQYAGIHTGFKRDAILLLGLGPNPLDIRNRLEEDGLLSKTNTIYYIEETPFIDQLPSHKREAFLSAIPQNWIPMEKNAIKRNRFGRIYSYRHALTLFPSFWGPLWAQTLFRPPKFTPTHQTVALVGDNNGLLIRELQTAFAELGFTVHMIAPDAVTEQLNKLFTHTCPELFLSINLEGFDDHGLLFERLCAAGIRCASWCVDNPFHLLSRIKAPFWKRLPLFVTDDWFCAPLRAHGAENVRALPLAVDPHIFKPGRGDSAASINTALFVGRSAFPGKNAFFAGCRLPADIVDQSEDALRHAERPHFGWWAKSLGQTSFWPDKSVRTVGFGAETASLALRTATLTEVGKECGLTVIGDEGWRDQLPGNIDLRPPVDYYGPLASLYEQAPVTLNMTSLLLPHGLTQRHFDVFAAGGLLITDNTPGLSLFPKDLTQPITFTAPQNAPSTIKTLLSNAPLARTLRADWRALLLNEHTYTKRLETLINNIL